MRIRVIDGVPHVLPPGREWWNDARKFWRPLDDRPEDREAREACSDFSQFVPGGGLPDGLFELVEEHHGACCSKVHRVGCACPTGWPRKTLRRVDDE